MSLPWRSREIPRSRTSIRWRSGTFTICGKLTIADISTGCTREQQLDTIFTTKVKSLLLVPSRGSGEARSTLPFSSNQTFCGSYETEAVYLGFFRGMRSQNPNLSRRFNLESFFTQRCRLVG